MLLRFLILAILSTMSISTFAQNIPPIEKGVSQELARWRAANYSDVRYKLNLTIEKKSPVLKGTIEINVKLKTENGKSNPIILDWRKIRGHEQLSKVSNVSVNGETANFEESNEHLIFKDNIKTGENVIKLDFESPILTSGSAVTRYIDKEDDAEYIYSLFVPSDASTAFPVFDQPDLKARFELSVHPPRNWNVISNTVVTRVRKCAMAIPIFSFEETKPISTYVFAFATGEFAEFDEQGRNPTVKEGAKAETSQNSAPSITVGFLPSQNPIVKEGAKDATSQHSAPSITVGFPPSKIYVRKSQAEKFKPHAEEVFRLNRESIKYLEDYFDYKFPFPKYDLVLIPEFPFGGMEHAGATFLRESSIIFPTEPTANNYISRANLIFHENAHQWFGDTVTMKWFDDLWLKEGFATFMAYKTMEKVMPEYNAWKVFYERTKPLAYQTDVTRGTTPIYQEIPNLSSAKSAYGNIVYQKAPSFLKQAEFFWGEEKFKKAVRQFLKNHEFANAEWKDLVKEIADIQIAESKKSDYYQKLSDGDKERLLAFEKWSVESEWAGFWVEKRGTAIYRVSPKIFDTTLPLFLRWNSAALGGHTILYENFKQEKIIEGENYNWLQDVKVLTAYEDEKNEIDRVKIGYRKYASLYDEESKPREEFNFDFEITEESQKKYEKELKKREARKIAYVFPNYQDYGYGIFLLDEKSKKYILANIQDEKDDFLRSMMWGSLWDSVRFAELAPLEYVDLALKNISVETDVSTISSILGRVDTAMTYYLSDAQEKEIAPKLESLLIDKIQNAETLEQRITFYRAFVNIASTDSGKFYLKRILGFNLSKNADPAFVSRKIIRSYENPKHELSELPIKTRDKFDIITKLIILGDKDAPKLLAELEKTETDDAAKRYAYAAKAGFATKENKAKYWNDFVNNKEISESWIEDALDAWNSPGHSELTLPYLEKALAELPNHKQNRKIFFVNGWVASFIGGQDSKEALEIVNKFLKDNPKLDIDLQRKILERLDGLERAVKIREKYGK